MIKANELRIGNYVEYLMFDEIDERKEWWQTDKIDAVDINTIGNMGFADHYRPIPITEEWLLRFGFDVLPKESGKRQTFIKKNMRLLNMGSYFILSYGKRVRIIHVHQLQNLYFALTGKELELKPETT